MQRILNIIRLLLFIGTFQIAFAQHDEHYSIKKAKGQIKLDGILSEPDWANADVATGFTEYFPFDSINAMVESEVMLSYDEDNLYFSAKMYNLNKDRTYVTPSLRRDYRGSANDGISLVFDTFQDNTNGFFFGINPYGVRREGLITNGDDLSLSWDNKWYGEAKKYEGYWIAEGAIPFKTLRFKEGIDTWNVNFYRIDSETAEHSTWTPIPRNFSILSLAFNRPLKWDKPLKKPSSNISVIPYISSNISRDFEDDSQTGADFNFEGGADAKIAIGPSLNLDLTINPDFSQVEVDRQVTNLQRFEIFFPERRQFFLENADLFSDFGHPGLARPFFSRRIGVAVDTSTGQNIQNRILYGLRLSGKLDNNWRIGFLNMQSAKDEEINLPSLNYTVAVAQRKVFSRSNVGLIFVNRQNLRDTLNNETSITSSSSYNRILGIDYNIASRDNKWNGKIFYHHEFDENPQPGQYAHSGWISYNSKLWNFSWAHVIIGDNYEARAGFVPRTGIYRINPEIGYTFFMTSGPVNNHRINADAEYFWNNQRKTDHRYTLRYNVRFQNNSRFEFSMTQRFTYLLDPFDPTNTDGEELLANTSYTYNTLGIEYQSDTRKKLSTGIEANYGEFFNGKRFRFQSEVNMRFQPYGALSMTFNYNNLRMADPINDADLFLVGPRLDVTMTKKLFLTTFLQYNSQIDNMNLNARFQWRYKQVSDLFIVYTDNYATENMVGDFNLAPKNRTLIIKLNHWFNL